MADPRRPFVTVYVDRSCELGTLLPDGEIVWRRWRPDMRQQAADFLALARQLGCLIERIEL